MTIIEIQQLTKDYGHSRGIFDVNLSVQEGEVFGFVGTNGAGKTTTIRHLMGFIKPQKGKATVHGFDCWKEAAKIKSFVGYVPGEIAFPEAATGYEFLKRQQELLGVTDFTLTKKLIDQLALDPSANLKRMSKGMKQKTAIVAAFMADPKILILDEPTTGLDPLMRKAFIDILREEKKKGKTIFMSSHMFDEVEEICDQVAFIKDGKIIDIKATKEIKHHQEKVYKIEFTSIKDYQQFILEPFTFTEKHPQKNQVVLRIHDQDINVLTKTLTNYEIKFFTEIKSTLEKHFQTFYERSKSDVK